MTSPVKAVSEWETCAQPPPETGCTGYEGGSSSKGNEGGSSSKDDPKIVEDVREALSIAENRALEQYREAVGDKATFDDVKNSREGIAHWAYVGMNTSARSCPRLHIVRKPSGSL